MATTDSAPAAEAPAQQPPKESAPLVCEYVDEQPRTYQFTDGTVITPSRGDVCTIPYDPGGGRWQPSKAKPTRLPDNDPLQAAKNAAARADARAKILDAASGKATP